MIGNTMQFPSTGMQLLSAFIHFTGVTVLAHCVSRRVMVESLTSFQAFAQLTWARLLIILTFVDSWLFLFTSGLIIFGAGMELNPTVCSLGIYFCIAFYASSKALIYAFLVEKVHIVWAPVAGSRKARSPIYLFCIASLVLYSAVVVVVLIGRIAYIRHDGVCIIGLSHLASIPLLAYDLYMNVLLTSLFLWPLFRSGVVNPVIRRVALRTLAASLIALTTSAINMLVLTLMRGQQLGWVCLGSCSTDVIVNAIVLFWVTSGSGQGDTSPSGPSGAVSEHPLGSRDVAPSQGGRRRAPPRPLSLKPVMLDTRHLPPSPRTPTSKNIFPMDDATRDFARGPAAGLLTPPPSAVTGSFSYFDRPTNPQGGMLSPPPSTASRVSFLELSSTPTPYAPWETVNPPPFEFEERIGSPTSPRSPTAWSRFRRGINNIGIGNAAANREPRNVEITITREYDVETDLERAGDEPAKDDASSQVGDSKPYPLA